MLTLRRQRRANIYSWCLQNDLARNICEGSEVVSREIRNSEEDIENREENKKREKKMKETKKDKREGEEEEMRD